MPHIKSVPLAEEIVNLVQTVSHVQEVFNEAYHLERERCARLLAHFGITSDNPTLDALMPLHLVISECKFEINLLLSIEKEVGIEVALRLNGFPIHSFFERRYGTSTRYRDHLSVVVEAVPIPQLSDKIKEKQNG